jgi:hypothetical protein
MLTIIYPDAFTRGLKGAAQGPGFDGCFAREQDKNMAEMRHTADLVVMDR